MLRALTFALILLAAGPAAAAGTLDRIAESGSIKMGYRTDAPPFSYEDADGEIRGFMVDLCHEVIGRIARQLEAGQLAIDYVAVTAENRFDAVSEGRIDLLCGPTSHTLSRREQVDFSLPTFNDGASLLLRAGGPQTLEAMEGRQIGVRAGTTSAELLRRTLQADELSAQVVEVDSHYDGAERLLAGELAGYFGDWGILFNLLRRSDSPERLRMSEEHFANELYALALPRNDADFRLAVDRGLAHTYDSPRLAAIFRTHFPGLSPTSSLRAIFNLFALRE